MTLDSAIAAKSLRDATAGVELRMLPLSPAMIALERAVENVAATRLPVLILGETGSGKKELARRIHFLAGGHLEELREIECVNLSAPELVHLTGSRERAGRLEQAAQNLTAVLVEISELDLMGQSALQEIVMLRRDERRKNWPGSFSCPVITLTKTCDSESFVRISTTGSAVYVCEFHRCDTGVKISRPDRLVSDEILGLTGPTKGGVKRSCPAESGGVRVAGQRT